MAKFQSQLDATERDMALARTLRGKISPTTTQAMGPHVEANAAMYRQMRATSAFWPEVLWTEIVTPMMAMRYSQMHMATAPQMSRLRRPKRSIPHIPGNVMNTLTMPVATEVKKGSEIPELAKNAVPSVCCVRNDRIGCNEERLTVEDEVDTSELLPRLNEDTREGTEGNLVVAGAEAVGIRALAEPALLLEIDTDILQLELEFRVVGREGSQAAHGGDRIRVAALLDQVTRRLESNVSQRYAGQQDERITNLREPDHTDGEDERPDELDGGGDTPRRVVVTVLGGIVDDVCEQDTNGDGPLVARHDRTTDPLGRALGLVHGDEGRHETDTETGADTTDDEGSPLVAADLEGDTEREDGGRKENTATTTEVVCDPSTGERTCRAKWLASISLFGQRGSQLMRLMAPA